jgi:hypothetical protein
MSIETPPPPIDVAMPALVCDGCHVSVEQMDTEGHAGWCYGRGLHVCPPDQPAGCPFRLEHDARLEQHRTTDTAAGLEARLLGAAMAHHRRAREIAPSVRPDHFGTHAHRLIFAAIRDVVADEDAPDFCAVADRLHRAGNLESAGGVRYLAGLTQPFVNIEPDLRDLTRQLKSVRWHPPVRRCALYFHYDLDDVLLYIGITDQPVQRGKEHAADSEWVRFAHRMEARWYDSRPAALEAERVAVESREPVFNRQYVPAAIAEQRRSTYLAAQGWAHSGVPTADASWLERNTGYGAVVLEAMCPVIPGGVAGFNRAYTRAKLERHPFAAVQQYGSWFDLAVDLETERYGAGLSDPAVAKLELLIVALARAGRINSGSSDRSSLRAYGARTATEAQVLGAIALEMNAGNHDGADGCLSALSDDGFVRPSDRICV